MPDSIAHALSGALAVASLLVLTTASGLLSGLLDTLLPAQGRRRQGRPARPSAVAAPDAGRPRNGSGQTLDRPGPPGYRAPSRRQPQHQPGCPARPHDHPAVERGTAILDDPLLVRPYAPAAYWLGGPLAHTPAARPRRLLLMPTGLGPAVRSGSAR
ncbi:hypothetical protein [Streptomyces aidingensis]|uniref:Uncharacterized protein n=1 Tax=Streptomyces aidingensis TaxID=910347 RepID=A0A1I1TJU0_9ACTN|nr:hypothetical protein [Streptomyces aidingensis]SFD58891.1 hypothetical protein SAMN05421773_12015 [Streptomyces aidingensis]